MNGESRDKEFLGKGLAFPLRVNARGEIALVSGAHNLDEAIRVILSTKPGERVMRPEFGCRAHELLFEPRTTATEARLKQYVMQALRMWEPRIDVQNVDVFVSDEVDGALFAEIQYRVKSTHDVRSIVYPFFLEAQEEW
jgi:phage baseplate assembly protein W